MIILFLATYIVLGVAVFQFMEKLMRRYATPEDQAKLDSYRQGWIVAKLILSLVWPIPAAVYLVIVAITPST